jgi:hypothetical protein
MWPWATTPVVIHGTIGGMSRLATACIAPRVALALCVTRARLCPSRATLGLVSTTHCPTSVRSRGHP